MFVHLPYLLRPQIYCTSELALAPRSCISSQSVVVPTRSYKVFTSISFNKYTPESSLLHYNMRLQDTGDAQSLPYFSFSSVGTSPEIPAHSRNCFVIRRAHPLLGCLRLHLHTMPLLNLLSKHLIHKPVLLDDRQALELFRDNVQRIH
jgi:hypothetical protein